ncbi:MAG: tRNA (adenosine(37)-N6)-threonylcarbamoyltransferase complex dimerization subunit type 1 TsaB [Clostridiales bacterium]|jgi:ribosomal protein S18 acetylase RimI-like enzyme|nr:tRNA (adenosine(37)-N6)-threonylcarbamoyltransferase complex dimerization subunit type 1 TsaB [Clostridiales bacterium]
MDYIAFDTTDKHLKALLVCGGKAYTHCEERELTHSETLLPALDSLLRAANRRLPDLQAVGVVTGPGSFTGIRIGIAAAKGLADAFPDSARSRSRLFGNALSVAPAAENIPAESPAPDSASGGLKIAAANSALLQSFAGTADSSDGFAAMRACFDAEIAAGEFLAPRDLKPVYLCNPQAAGAFKLAAEPMAAADAEQAAVLEKRYFTNPETREMLLNRIFDPSSRAVCVRDGDLLCAYLVARAAGGVCELETVAVRRVYRRLGFSQILMNDLKDFARGQNCACIRLEAREDNRPALALYEKFGFVKTAIRKNYYADGGNAVLYELKIEN